MAAHIAKTPTAQPRNLLHHALEYHALGLSILRLPSKSKIAATGWKKHQHTAADESQVRRWFGDNDRSNIAVVLGAVSGWLVCRDFDEAESYHSWKSSHQSLALSLPTGQTARGYHVYCRTTAAAVAALRASIGKPRGTGAITLIDGEFRCGNCYCLLPPSIHPDGPTYLWLQPFGPTIPTVDLAELIGPMPHSTHRHTQHTQAIKSNGTVSTVGAVSTVWHCDSDSAAEMTASALLERIQHAIAVSIPEAQGQRNINIFAFARRLKAIPELSEKNASELRCYFKLWHAAAVDHIRTKDWETNWLEFVKAWQNVRMPTGSGPLAEAYFRAEERPAPEATEFEYESAGLRLFVAFCRELQIARGSEPFFIGCRTAAELFKTEPRTVSRWLQVMCVDGLLHCESKGNLSTGNASEFRWRGPL